MRLIEGKSPQQSPSQSGLTQPQRKKKRPREAGVKLLRQVSYRQETYRAVSIL
jgi:hypothetical protein